MATAYLSLGSNLGDRLENMQQAVAELAQNLQKLKVSALYSTQPVEMKEDTMWFLNAVAFGETDLIPEELLNLCMNIEKKLGRVRTNDIKYEPRIMDVDILFYGHEIIKTDRLVIPHPLVQHRKFILIPMAELSPSYRHPILKKTIWELLAECKDTSAVEQYYGTKGV